MLDILALIFGIIGGTLILASVAFRCVTVKMNILMRTLNSLGGLFFVADGICMICNGQKAGWSLIPCNLALVGFNLFFIVKMILSLKKEAAQPSQEQEPAQESQPEQAE